MKIAILAGTASKHQRFRWLFYSQKVNFAQLVLSQILNISRDREQKSRISEWRPSAVKGGAATGCRQLPEGEGGGKPPRFQRFIEIDNTLSKHAWLPEVTGGFTGLRSAADPSLTSGTFIFRCIVFICFRWFWKICMCK